MNAKRIGNQETLSNEKGWGSDPEKNAQRGIVYLYNMREYLSEFRSWKYFHLEKEETFPPKGKPRINGLKLQEGRFWPNLRESVEVKDVPKQSELPLHFVSTELFKQRFL